MSDSRRVQLKRLATCTLGKMVQSSPTEGSAHAPYLRAAHVQPGGRLIHLPDQRMWFTNSELRTLTLRRDDVVVVEGGAGYGRSAVLREDLDSWGFQNSIVRVRPIRECSDGRFLDYAIQAALRSGEIDSLVSTATIPHFTAEKVARLPIVGLPAEQQRAIADYLDRETAQIDAFIAKNEELITLLNERRASVIREATTVGLGTRTELVESGLGGVGPIPSGWRVMRLSWLFRATGSGTTPPSELMLDGNEAEVWWVTTGELRERTITSTSKGISADTLATSAALKIHPSGSLLIAMYGATIGRMGVLAVPAASNQAVCALSNPVGCSVEFVEYAMLAARERLLLAAVGGGQPNINQETVRAFRIPVPDLDEQRAIVQYLRERIGDIDSAIAAAGSGIELARERRAALVSAAVAGKIEMGVQT